MLVEMYFIKCFFSCPGEATENVPFKVIEHPHFYEEEATIHMSCAMTKPTIMDPDQPEHLRSLIRIHAVRLQTLLQVEKLIATAWILIRLRRCAGWFGSMLVANPLCLFCHDTAHIIVRLVLKDQRLLVGGFSLFGLYTVVVFHTG
jgi:hypothetical protein